MSRSIKLWQLFLLVVAVFSLGLFFYHKQNYRATHGFSTAQIQFDFPHREEWEIPHLSKDKQAHIDQILRQSFSYLGKGARAFSFLSADGHYVLKFFKNRYQNPHWAVRLLPALFPFESYRQRKMRKVSLDTVLSGYKIAYDRDPQGTGLLYIHLNPTNGSHHPVVTVMDKQGKAHLVNLNETRFILQRRVQELTELLNTLLDNQDSALAQKRLEQIFDLYLSHYQKGMYDLGTGILRNNGFIEDEPIHFDVGKMTLDERICNPLYQRDKLVYMAKKVESWLMKHHPEYCALLTRALENKLAEIYKEK